VFEHLLVAENFSGGVYWTVTRSVNQKLQTRLFLDPVTYRGARWEAVDQRPAMDVISQPRMLGPTTAHESARFSLWRRRFPEPKMINHGPSVRRLRRQPPSPPGIPRSGRRR
jgi:hypothetical protein